MNRLGLDSKSIVTIFKKTADFPRLIMNHYACADDPENPMNHNQANKIKAIEKQCDYPLTSFANSATVIANKNPLGDIARVGIMLFGHNPIRNHVQLANVSTFEAPVIAIQTIEKNDRVGYGSLWKNDEKGYLAIIRAGYADGYPQTMPSGTPVFCKNKKHFIAGRTSMDLIAIYLGQNQTNVDVGDMVELWGENIHIDEAADAANTSAYELFTRISPRVQRVYYS